MYYESCALTIPAMFSCFESFIVSRDRTALGYTRGVVRTATHVCAGGKYSSLYIGGVVKSNKKKFFAPSVRSH